MKLILLILSISISYACDLTSLSHFNAEVTKLVDGDTVHVTYLNKKIKVRLLGIDTPELHFQNRSQPMGQEATDYLETMLSVGDKVTVYYEYEKFDKYGRTLGHIEKNGVNINLELLKSGMAVVYIIYPNRIMMNCYFNATEKAYKQHLGMFNNPRVELPFEFRTRTSGSKYYKYVVDIESKKLYTPNEYNKVPIWNRLFFFNKNDALLEGYTYEN